MSPYLLIAIPVLNSTFHAATITMLLALINYTSLIKKKYDVHPCPAVKNTY